MGSAVQLFLAAGLFSTFALLGTARLRTCVRWAGFQGLAFGMVPILLHQDIIAVRIGMLVASNLLIKGFVFPWLLLRLCRRLTVRREVDPYIGLPGTILLGVGFLGLATWLGIRVGDVIGQGATPLLVAAFFLIFAGLLLIISRHKAVLQVLGYMTLENGIYVFGSAVVISTPMLVEFGVLMDVFVAVFVMGIAIDRIHMELASTDVARLSRLKG